MCGLVLLAGLASAVAGRDARGADIKFSDLMKSSASLDGSYVVQVEQGDVLVFDNNPAGHRIIGTDYLLKGARLAIYARQARVNTRVLIQQFPSRLDGPFTALEADADPYGGVPAGVPAQTRAGDGVFTTTPPAGLCHQNGCDGAPGLTGNKGHVGNNGAGGADIVMEIGSLTGTGVLSVSANGQGGGTGQQGGQGGVGGEGGHGVDRGCSAGSPGNGGTGGGGGQGGPGGNGGSGGKGARIVISQGLLSPWESGRLVLLAPGGAGGRRGSGGAGGLAGAGGARGRGASCGGGGDSGKPGSPSVGNPGNPGALGDAGPDGSVSCPDCLPPFELASGRKPEP